MQIHLDELRDHHGQSKNKTQRMLNEWNYGLLTSSMALHQNFMILKY